LEIRCPPRRQLTTIPISISIARTRWPFAVVDFDIADKLAPSAITSSMCGDAEYAARAGLQLVSGYTILVLSTNILLSSLTMVTHLVRVFLLGSPTHISVQDAVVPENKREANDGCQHALLTAVLVT